MQFERACVGYKTPAASLLLQLKHIKEMEFIRNLLPVSSFNGAVSSFFQSMQLTPRPLRRKNNNWSFYDLRLLNEHLPELKSQIMNLFEVLQYHEFSPRYIVKNPKEKLKDCNIDYTNNYNSWFKTWRFRDMRLVEKNKDKRIIKKAVGEEPQLSMAEQILL